MINDWLQHLRPHLWLICCIVVLLLFDVAVPAMFNWAIDGGPELPSIAVLSIGVGGTAAQLNLIAVWAALAPGRLLVRIPWSLVLLTAVWFALIFGKTLLNHRSEKEISDLGTLLLAGFCVIQIPMWIARQFLGWQLIHSKNPRSGKRNFSISELMLGTFVLALLLGLGRALLPSDDLTLGMSDNTLLALGTALIVTNLFVVVPVIWLSYRKQNVWGAWVFANLLASAFEFAALIAVLGSPGSDGFNIFLALLMINLTQCAVVIAVMSLMKAHGFQLKKISNKNPKNSASNADATV